MTLRYKLRKIAKDDIKEIGRYTLRNHGKKQRNQYLTGLKNHFDLLAENPNLGCLRKDVKNGYHCSEYNKHSVFYLIQKDYIDILAVLHNKMLPRKYL